MAEKKIQPKAPEAKSSKDGGKTAATRVTKRKLTARKTTARKTTARKTSV